MNNQLGLNKPQQKIVYTLPSSSTKWETMTRGYAGGATIATYRYIPATQNSSDWVQAVYEGGTPQLQNFNTSLIQQLEATYKPICQSTNIKTLSSSANIIVLEGNLINCKHYGNLYLVAKVIKGNDRVYDLQYMAKTDQTNAVDINKGKKMVVASYLANN